MYTVYNQLFHTINESSKSCTIYYHAYYVQTSTHAHVHAQAHSDIVHRASSPLPSKAMSAPYGCWGIQNALTLRYSKWRVQIRSWCQGMPSFSLNKIPTFRICSSVRTADSLQGRLSSVTLALTAFNHSTRFYTFHRFDFLCPQKSAPRNPTSTRCSMMMQSSREASTRLTSLLPAIYKSFVRLLFFHINAQPIQGLRTAHGRGLL